ncbi:sulfur carrier protein ThiS [Campylobacter concisus]|jgi:thiamine biosynthesis protein thiS|uniref:Sulfur carrier protein ThiS n=1 Tax=Campylobacter concisus TaxID=199 RepID=A0A7S9R6Z7_9BACT|nr:sulfur carrier protein ThiS [Campylobacter concisus]QPH84448.1 sulfur carrier protein ThiS [Campylobacter concisus]
MIKFILNGKIFELENDMSVYDFLAQNGYELKFIALERDGEILPKKLWSEHFMSEAKTYEIVTLVGGG